MGLRTVDSGYGDHQLRTTALGYGAMSIAGAYGPIDQGDALSLLQRVVDCGVTFIDTANIYGHGLSEKILGQFLAGRREEVTLATKCGIMPSGEAGKRTVNGRPEHIRAEIDLSLQRLGTDYVDLYYLHRPDPTIPIEESAGALGDLVTAGKVRTIGLSEATAEEIRRAHETHPVTAVQSEWSLFARDVEEYVLPACAELGIGFVAFSPVGRGMITDRFSPDHLSPDDTRHKFPWFAEENIDANMQLVARVRQIAAEAGVPTAGLALAWLYTKAQGLGVTATTIPGTRYAEHLDELLTGVDGELPAELVAALDQLADQVAGERSFDSQWVSGGREGLIPRSSSRTMVK